MQCLTVAGWGAVGGAAAGMVAVAAIRWSNRMTLWHGSRRDTVSMSAAPPLRIQTPTKAEEGCTRQKGEDGQTEPGSLDAFC